MLEGLVIILGKPCRQPALAYHFRPSFSPCTYAFPKPIRRPDLSLVSEEFFEVWRVLCFEAGLKEKTVPRELSCKLWAWNLPLPIVPLQTFMAIQGRNDHTAQKSWVYILICNCTPIWDMPVRCQIEPEICMPTSCGNWGRDVIVWHHKLAPNLLLSFSSKKFFHLHLVIDPRLFNVLNP